MPILATGYGVALISLTSLPIGSMESTVISELLTVLLSLAAIALTLFLVKRYYPVVFPSSAQFSFKSPSLAIIAGILLIAPLWFVTKEYIIYGLTSLTGSPQLEPMTCSTQDLKEDLIAGVHAVLLAPVLEELCFRQMAISPFNRRGARITVVVIMAVLFGILHVRNFPVVFLDAMVFGLLFVWTKNIWYSVACHAGGNLTAIFLEIYCWSGLGRLQISGTPVILLPDLPVIIVSILLAVAGLFLIKRYSDTSIQKQ